jgi:putative ABC transport system substrate-binding protein
VIEPGDPVSRRYRVEAFRRGLRELGYVEGKNLIIEYRYARTNLDRLSELARELVRLEVDIISAGGRPATEAAKNTTLTIPIVTSSGEPVESGLAAGLAQPEGNITGLTNLSSELVGKRLELLKEVIPRLSRVGFLCAPGSDRRTLAKAELAAQSMGVQLQAALIGDRDDLERAFAAIKRGSAEAMLMVRNPLLVNDLRKRILDLAEKSRLPAIYDDRVFPQLGGLMSYGVILADLDRGAAIYIHKILKGAKPANLPVKQPAKFELLINFRTAKALGKRLIEKNLLEAYRGLEKKSWI